MSIFVKKVEKTLSERLDGIKSLFTSAHTEAVELSKEIEAQLEVDKIALEEAKKAVDETTALQSNNLKFISNLEKFI